MKTVYKGDEEFQREQYIHWFAWGNLFTCSVAALTNQSSLPPEDDISNCS
jgi:hypothetical protein